MPIYEGMSGNLARGQTATAVMGQAPLAPAQDWRDEALARMHTEMKASAGDTDAQRELELQLMREQLEESKNLTRVIKSDSVATPKAEAISTPSPAQRQGLAKRLTGRAWGSVQSAVTGKNPQLEAAREQMIDVQHQWKLTAKLVQDNRVELEKRAETDANIANLLKTVDVSLEDQQNVYEKFLDRQEVSIEEAHRIHSSLNSTTDLLSHIDTQLEVNVQSMMTEYQNSIMNQKLSDNQRAKLVADAVKMATQAGVSSDALDELTDITKKKINFDEVSSLNIADLLGKINNQSADKTLTASSQQLNKQFDSMLLTQGELTSAMKASAGAGKSLEQRLLDSPQLLSSGQDVKTSMIEHLTSSMGLGFLTSTGITDMIAEKISPIGMAKGIGKGISKLRGKKGEGETDPAQEGRETRRELREEKKEDRELREDRILKPTLAKRKAALTQSLKQGAGAVVGKVGGVAGIPGAQKLADYMMKAPKVGAVKPSPADEKLKEVADHLEAATRRGEESAVELEKDTDRREKQVATLLEHQEDMLEGQEDIVKATEGIETGGGRGGIMGMLGGLLSRRRGKLGMLGSLLTGGMGMPMMGGGMGMPGMRGGGKGIGKLLRKIPGGRMLGAVAGGGLMKKGGGLLSKIGGKGLAKVAGKGVGKSLLKKIPLVGLLAGGAFAASRAMKGDFTGAMGELASGAASTIPGVGTAASVAIDAALAGKDMMAEGKAETPEAAIPATEMPLPGISKQLKSVVGEPIPVGAPSERELYRAEITDDGKTSSVTIPVMKRGDDDSISEMRRTLRLAESKARAYFDDKGIKGSIKITLLDTPKETPYKRQKGKVAGGEAELGLASVPAQAGGAVAGGKIGSVPATVPETTGGTPAVSRAKTDPGIASALARLSQAATGGPTATQQRSSSQGTPTRRTHIDDYGIAFVNSVIFS